MAQIEITLTDDISINPLDPNRTGQVCVGATIYERFDLNGNLAGFHSDFVTFHGTREQLTAFAHDLLEKVTLTKWVPETTTETEDPTLLHVIFAKENA